MTPADGWAPLAVVPAIAIVAALTRAMTPAGAAAGAAIALPLAFGLGWAGVAMLATLLIVGTLVSDRTARRRSPWQAAGNGAVAAVAAISGAPWAMMAAAGALATALADTAASELGHRFGGVPRALLFGRRMEPGADGGMSLVGTLAAAIAACLVPVAAWATAGTDGDAFWMIAVAGFSGHVVDSVIGLFVQPKLGSRGNDWTNLLATASGAAMAVTMSLL